MCSELRTLNLHAFALPPQILSLAEEIPLEDTSRSMIYDLLCSLANPSRIDTRGLSYLADIAERFAFSLLTDVACDSSAQRSVAESLRWLVKLQLQYTDGSFIVQSTAL